MLNPDINKILQKIENAKEESPSKSPITIVGVVKYQTIEDANNLIQFGIKDIAENYVQSLTERAPLFLPCKKHLIGHLQTNKVKAALLYADMIQSVDSIHLLQEIQKQSSKLNKTTEILIQVNISKEEAKSGCDVSEVNNLISFCAECPNISLKGLMAIMPIDKNPLFYQKMYELFIDKKEFLVHNINSKNISMDYLSMGMSNDYELAVKCGANMLRLGRTLFI